MRFEESLLSSCWSSKSIKKIGKVAKEQEALDYI